MVLSQLHLPYEIRNYQVYDSVGRQFVSKLIYFSVTSHHSIQFFALFKFISIQTTQNTVHICVHSLVNGNIEIKGCQELSLQINDVVSVHEPAGLGNEVSDLGWIDLVHLAGYEQTSDCYFFFVVVVERYGQLVEDGYRYILSILLHLLMEIEDPFDGVFSVLIVQRLD